MPEINTEKTTLVVNYIGMQFGGVETAFAELMLYALSQGFRVIWLTTPNGVQSAAHREIADCAEIEKIFTRSSAHSAYTAAFRCEGERVVAVSCEPLSFARAESLRGRLGERSFEHYLIMPNFRGKIYFPEQLFGGPAKAYCRRVMRRFAHRLNETGCLRGFALQHLEAYERNYGIAVEDKPQKILGGLRRTEPPERAFLMNKAGQRSRCFEIVACSRFDFPHKGFLLGLTDAYADLKPTFPQMKLTVVGYGAGEAQLREKIAALPAETARDIELTGALPLDEVKRRFKGAHLNIGVAGALLDGAACGVPSLVARHFSDSCETYGFLSDVPERLRDDPGEDIRPYIRAAVTMTDDAYAAQAKKDFTCAEQIFDYRPYYIFEQDGSRGRVLTRGDILRLRLIKLAASVKLRFVDTEEFA